MRFAVLSDTHDNIHAVRDLIDDIGNERLEFVVHAGDVVAPFTIRELFKLEKKFYIAYGNNDGDRNLLSRVCSEKDWVIGEIVEFPGGVVYHGTDGRIKAILSSLTELGKIVVFGHTHEVHVEKRGSGLILNPVEVCGYLTGKRTYAIVEDGEVSIVEF